jgi:hypothetical protein
MSDADLQGKYKNAINMAFATILSTNITTQHEFIYNNIIKNSRSKSSKAVLDFVEQNPNNYNTNALKALYILRERDRLLNIYETEIRRRGIEFPIGGRC